MSTVRGMSRRGGVARWTGHSDRKLNYSSSSLDSDGSDHVGNDHNKGPSHGNVRGRRTTPPPASFRSGMNTPPPVKPSGTNDGVMVNGSVSVGGKSFNTSSSNINRIGGKPTKDKKYQNGFPTTKLNHTNKISVLTIERKLDQPALVKDHIPTLTSNNELQETSHVQKELKEEKNSIMDQELYEGDKEFQDEKHNQAKKNIKETEKNQEDSNSEEEELVEEKPQQKVENVKEEVNKPNKKDYLAESDSQEKVQLLEGRSNSQKDKDIQEGKSTHNNDKFKEIRDNKLDIELSANKSDEKIDSHESKIFRSISQNKITKGTGKKNSLEYQNNKINKSHYMNEDKKYQKQEDIKYSINQNNSEKIEVKTTVQKPEGYVGFASLPGQVCRKAVRKGFEFTLMVVGESGLGKSTLVNSMFLTDIYSSKFPGVIPNVPKTLNVETHEALLEEGGVKLSLTVVDTPGFGDAVDNTGCWEPITNFVDQQYEKFLQAETRVNRVELADTRVHVCIYFIAPSGHGLKPLDIEFMSRLHDKVNIIPVIGKADACSQDELKDFKQKILTQIADSKIQIYSFPEGEKDEVDWMRKRMPFAVVGSNTIIDGDEGKRVRGRKYPWGTVIIENKDHCDFLPLRDLLLAHHMQDLKDVTNYVHYENFRCRRLTEMFSKDGRDILPNKNPLAALEDEAKEHTKNMDKTMEDMEEVFGRKVEEKEEKLKESERNMEEILWQTKGKLEEQKNELERQREEFLNEKKVWQDNNCVPSKNLRRKKSLESLLGGAKKKYGLGMMTFKIGKNKNDDF